MATLADSFLQDLNDLEDDEQDDVPMETDITETPGNEESKMVVDSGKGISRYVLSIV